MPPALRWLLENANLICGPDGIYSVPLPPLIESQEKERRLREAVAAATYPDYLAEVSRHHSIPVMDHEVRRFLAHMPQGAVLLDIGGCWGWHWRHLQRDRPDVGVIIMDFVRPNLIHAQRVLAPLVGHQVVLLHADAHQLPFPEPGVTWPGFDGVWTVQVFQHIPDFSRVCTEAHRVLRPGGWFANYSLHATPVNRVVYRLVGRQYHLTGAIDGLFFLERANDRQRAVITELFDGNVQERYTECLFHPDLRFRGSGRAGSWLGRLDAALGDAPWIGRWCARQRSISAQKQARQARQANL